SALGAYNGNARWVLSGEMRSALSQSVFSEPDFADWDASQSGVSWPDRSIAAYMLGYLQEDILVKVDRASMAVSLEVRAPFLDPDLLEFLATVPNSLKLKGFQGKYLLRRLMRGRLPQVIIDRPKHGFGVPINNWLRTALAPMVRDLLDPHRIAEAGIFNSGEVSRLVSEHLAGKADRGNQVWSLLLF